MIRKIDTDDISETFKPLSNLKVVKSDKIKLSEFRSKYKEYSISKPYIITDVLPDREGHEKIKGKPVIFISMDKTIPENQLMDRYLSNLEHKKDPGTVQDVRMIFLNMDQISFADWLKTNRKFYKEAIKNKKQTRGKGVYENKYLAARALANII